MRLEKSGRAGGALCVSASKCFDRLRDRSKPSSQSVALDLDCGESGFDCSQTCLHLREPQAQPVSTTWTLRSSKILGVKNGFKVLWADAEFHVADMIDFATVRDGTSMNQEAGHVCADPAMARHAISSFVEDFPIAALRRGCGPDPVTFDLDILPKQSLGQRTSRPHSRSPVESRTLPLNSATCPEMQESVLPYS